MNDKLKVAVGLNPFFFRAGFEGPSSLSSPSPRGLNPFFFRAGFEGEEVVEWPVCDES